MSLKVDHIVKTYGSYTAVDGLNFEMNAPGVFALLGTNGAGKTTSIRIILGMLAADSGKVTWNGKPFLTAEEPIGYLAEERGLYPKYKIMDQLIYFCSLKGMKRADAARQLDYWFDRLNVNEARRAALKGQPAENTAYRRARAQPRPAYPRRAAERS